MIRRLAVILGLAGAILAQGTATHAEADRKHPLDWLRNEPLTLFEWGTVRLERDLINAGNWLANRSYAEERAETGVSFNWRANRLTAYYSVERPPDGRTAEACRLLFRQLADRMMRRAPGGPGQASWYLQSVFLPEGRWWSRPSRKFGRDLIRVVQLEVVLRKREREAFSGSAPQVSCYGGFDAEGDAIKDKVTH